MATHQRWPKDGNILQGEHPGSPVIGRYCFLMAILISMAACSGKGNHSSERTTKPEKPVAVEVFLRPEVAATDVTTIILPLAKQLKGYVSFHFHPIAPGSEATGDPDALPHRIVDDCGYHYEPNAKGSNAVSRTEDCQKVPRDMSLVCGQKYASENAAGAFVDCYFEKLNKSPVGTFELRSCPNKGAADKDSYQECVRSAEGAELLRASYLHAGERQLGEDDFSFFVNGTGYMGMKGLKNAICPLLPLSSDSETFATPTLCKGFKADKNVTFTVISDRSNCPLPACKDSIFAKNVRQLFENAYVTEMDWSEAKAKEMYRKSGAKHLPVAISDGDIQTASEDSRRIALLSPVKGSRQFIYSYQNGWDPMTEICDDGKDNNSDGKVDCEEDSCKEQMFCQPAQEKRVDMFVSLPFTYADVNAVFMMQYMLTHFKVDASQMAFRIHFVKPGSDNTILEATTAEAKRRLCIQRNYSKNFAYLTYFNCRRAKTDADGWEKCLTPKMNVEQITTCASGEDGDALLAASYKLAEQMAVPGTPYWVVNSKYPVKSTTSSFSIRTPSEIVALYCEKNAGVEGCQDGYGAPRPKVEWRYSEAAGLNFTKTEITVDQFRHFLSGRQQTLEGDYAMLGHDGDSPDDIDNEGFLPFAGHKRYPVIGVGQKDAEAFCEWIGGRLPTEREWLSEATDNWKRNWPWGSESLSCGHAVVGRNRYSKWPCAGTGYNTVCTKPAGHSKSGLCDMVGNVHEIVRADFPNTDRKSAMGGCYSSWRGGYGVMFYMDTLLGADSGMGFRCVKSDVPESATHLKFEAACRRLQNLQGRDPGDALPKKLYCEDHERFDPEVSQLSRKHLFLKKGKADESAEDYKWLGFNTCMPFKEGAMMLTINPVPCRYREDATHGSKQRPVIIYAAAKGAISHVDLNNLYLNSNETMRLNGPYDLNGDGNKDMVKLFLSYDSEEYTGSWTGMIQYREGRIVPVDFSDALDIDFTLADIGDRTGDGRPDLLFERSVYGSQCGSGFDWEYGTLTVLAEIRPDGSFDFRSSGAEKWMREQCPEKPEKLHTVERVACARVWGMPEGEAIKKIKSVRSEGCRNDNDDIDDFPALMAAATIKFPVTLRWETGEE